MGSLVQGEIHHLNGGGLCFHCVIEETTDHRIPNLDAVLCHELLDGPHPPGSGGQSLDGEPGPPNIHGFVQGDHSVVALQTG